MKSILVIDTPKDCYECPCYDHEGGICQAVINWKTDRENGCPLRPLPKKKDVPPNYGMMVGDPRGEGWNECLDELEK